MRKEKQNRTSFLDDQLYNDLEKRRRLGFDATIAQVEWLLIAVVFFYSVIPGVTLTGRPGVIRVMMVYTVTVLIFHHLGLQHLHRRWKTWLEALIMTVVVTYVVWHSGRITSPLLSLYLLVVIASATTLGLKPTLLQAAVITVIYMFITFAPSTLENMGVSQARLHLFKIFPFWLVAYLATMLAYEAETDQLKLAELAHTDSLTELWNMRMFAEFAEHEYERAARYQRSFAVMMLDADNLKMINDNFGHQTGGQMIRFMGKKIRMNLRTSDVVARYGGDEFIVMLPETSSSEALVTAERVRKCLDDSRFYIGSVGFPVAIKVSIGIAAFPEHDKELAGILQKADAALYHSKKLGKNRSSIYSDAVLLDYHS